MSIVVHAILALLAFGLHVGIASLTLSGVPIHALAIITVIAVWRQSPRAIACRILPAALGVDLLQPTHFPVTVFTVLAVWVVASLIQKHWLTNHSLASLAGIVILAMSVRLCATWIGIAISAFLGGSSVPVVASWTWSDNLLRLLVESCITIGLGAAWQFFQHILRRTFIYGTR